MEFEEKPIHTSMSISLHYSNIWFNYWGLLSIKGGGDSSNFTEGVVLKRRILLRISKYQAQYKYELIETSHPYKWFYLCPKRWSRCLRKQGYYKTPKSTPPMSQGLLAKRQDVASPKLWRGSSKLPSFSLTQPMQALRRRSDTHWEIKLNVLYRSHEAFDQSPAALIVTFQVFVTGQPKAAALSTGALPPVTLKATPRWEVRKMEGNLFSDQEILIWWKPRPEQDKDSGGQRLRSKGMGVVAVTKSRKALCGVISGHGRWKEI